MPVDAVIVSHNTRAMLGECLRSLVDEGSCTITVVDNASSDGSPAMVSVEFPRVALVLNEENVGFARAVNQGLQLCSSDFVLLLNSDSTLTPGALGAMTTYMRDHPAVGAVGPAVHHPSGRLRVLSAGRQPSLWRVFTHFSGLSHLSRWSSVLDGWNHRIGIHDRRPHEVEWIAGGCLLLRSAALKQVGPLSERWFMYAEDLELCARLMDAGWKLVHVPDAVVYHHVAGSAPVDGPISTLWIESMKDYYRLRWAPGPLRDLAWRLTVGGGLAIRSLVYGAAAASNRGRSRMWRLEARRFAAYALAAVKR
jgi:GT2 family glycosyltransferase